MKKRFFAVALVALACSAPAFAASKNYQKGKDMGIGLNLGYPGVGAAVRYHNDDLRILGAVAFDFLNGRGIAIDATGEYVFARLELDEDKRHIIDLSAGAGLGVGIPFSGSPLYMAFELGLIGNYNIPDTDFSIFLRGLWRPYLVFEDPVKFHFEGFGASIGFTYNFKLED